MVTLISDKYGYRLRNFDGREIYIQSDWDYPAIASDFGWVACTCGMTDGTIDCKHKKASDMIVAAREFLDEHDGKRIKDPGFFENSYHSY